MPRRILSFLAVALFVAPALFAAEAQSPPPSQPARKASKPYKIAVIPKGTTHSFWKSIHAGAAKAAAEFGIDAIWMGPQREDDRSMQIQVVENFISQKVDGIVLAPLDSQALMRPVQEAKAAGIPTVIIDSDLNSPEIVSFVATDNRLGGSLAAKRLGELLGGKGKVMMMRYEENSASTQNREEGFLETMKKDFPGIELVSTNQYGGATVDLARKKADSLLLQFAQLDGIFCPNESSTMGMLQALKADGRAGKVKFAGFDSNDMLIQAMRDGQIQGLTLQNPFKMGYLGVKTMVDHLEGRPVEKRVDTGVVVVTPENLDTPEIKELISPDLKKWLNE
ncbi:MAG: substrate-binding domain-containing protein [Candidatus Sumerlaeota bacterium]|nr:substrate-binding domain-containing protein [Candidatus Sumerlaeota bacterium]